jgi:hypothetical protein
MKTLKNQDHLYIDGKRMNIIGTPVPVPHGFYKVKVGEGSVATAEHSIPALFMEGHDQFSSVRTGGCEYKWRIHPALDESKPPPPPKPSFERQVVPVLSTNHISEDADQWLQTWDGRRGPIILAPYDAGYFFRVLLDHDDVALIPQSIREVAEWAAAKGYDWVRIDSTVPTIDDLTSYNW